MIDLSVASEEEILEFWSDVMRCRGYHAENTKLSDSVKAAENLAKYYGMFGDKKESACGDVIIIDNIAEAESDAKS
ncbi:MAG: terminase small subunit [Firmicutes bacterium]|nr:terminase small subunit [Bacillota bacterium]